LALSLTEITMLNGLWLGFFLIAALAALARWLLGGDPAVFAALVQSLFDMARLSVEVMVLLFGTLTLWLGFLRIAEMAGLVDWLGRMLGPLFSRLMPEVPRGHPALGFITLNFAANGLGLDNAATPIGLKAMRALQDLNPSATTASNAQILFLVLNASSLTLLPVSIFMYRVQQGAPDPTLVFLPILLATSASTLVGLLSVALMQRLRLWDPVVLAYLLPGALLLGGFMALLATLSSVALATLSSLLGNLTLFGLIVMFLLLGAVKRVPVYESFVEGAKEGFEVAKNLLPYLVAMLCAVGVLRASGALEFGLDGIRWLVEWGGWDNRFVDALPTALVKPFSGSAARAMLIETMQTHGVDSFPALVAAVMQGSTETTFYVLAVYFGAVGIQRARHAVGCALLADLAGVVAAIGVCYWFFG
jgi:spore maturation protein SpmA